MPATCTSAARINANRQNALRSTGPRTESGKQRSRVNAVKHGLTGAGVALPDEDHAAVEALFHSIHDELAPQTSLGSVLAHQVALMSVRFERSARHESAAVAARMEQAERDFDQARTAEVDALLAALDADPLAPRRRLLMLPAGVERLIDGLLGLLERIDRDRSAWTDAEERRFEALCGRAWADATPSRAIVLSRAVGGDDAGLDPTDRARFGTDADRRDWAVDQLTLLVNAEARGLLAHRRTLDPTATDADRARAINLALFDPGKEASLARRYEAAAHREFYRALHEFRQVEASSTAAPLAPSAIPRAVEPPPLAAVPEPTPIDPELAVDQERNLVTINELRAPLGSFGTALDDGANLAPGVVDDIERRRNRPRVDRLSKRHRRRK